MLASAFFIPCLTSSSSKACCTGFKDIAFVKSSCLPTSNLNRSDSFSKIFLARSKFWSNFSPSIVREAILWFAASIAAWSNTALFSPIALLRSSFASSIFWSIIARSEIRLVILFCLFSSSISKKLLPTVPTPAVVPLSWANLALASAFSAAAISRATWSLFSSIVKLNSLTFVCLLTVSKLFSSIVTSWSAFSTANKAFW